MVLPISPWLSHDAIEYHKLIILYKLQVFLPFRQLSWSFPKESLFFGGVYFSQQLWTVFTSSFHLKIFFIFWNFLWLYIYTIINKVNYGWLNIKNRCFLKNEKNTWIQTMTSNFLALQTVSVQCWLILHQKAETPLVTKKALSNNSVRTANHVCKCSADPFNKS